MSVLDALRDLLGPRAKQNVAVTYAVRAAGVLNMGPAELYRKQPHLRAVISYLADNVADVPLKCYIRASDDSRPRDTNSTFARLIARPSCDMTAFEYVRGITTDLCLFEHALALILPDVDPRSSTGWQLKYIPWSWVQANSTLDGFNPSGFKVINPYTGGMAEFDASDCVHYYNYDPSGAVPTLFGSGLRIDALRQVLAEQISAWNFRNGVWRNSGQVTQFLTRPVNAAKWEPKDRARFAQSWKEKFAGKNGTNTGGTPMLEDGMELKVVPFNARESQFVEATQLTREDVAAVYHINPSTIWHSETQTYASAKDNARALYAEALSPIFTLIQQRNNAVIPAKLGLDESYYCEFDLSKKLAASFEEQASVLQSSAGGPWITRNEARARMNLPAIEGGDELIVPLNVVAGGLASPNDTDPTKSALPSDLEQVSTLQLSQGEAKPDIKDASELPKAELRFESKASGATVKSVADVLRAFYKRQATTFANVLASMEPEDMAVPWEQKKRWVRELSKDLHDACGLSMVDAAREALRTLGLDPDDYDLSELDKPLTAVCNTRGQHIVVSTMQRLEKELQDAAATGDLTKDNVRELVTGLYDRLMEGRVDRNASSLATACANAGTVHGARLGDAKCVKQWIATGHNTRDSHAAINGEQAPIDGTFSNNAHWPGDTSLPAAETCNCHCRIEIVSSAGR